MVEPNRTSANWRSKAYTFGAIMVITLAGPAAGLGLASRGLVLAPPWTSLTSWIYIALAGLGPLIGIVLGLMKRLKTRWLFMTLTYSALIACFYLVILGPWLPKDVTHCQPVPSTSAQARYTCIAASSDDYSHEVQLEGWAGWPVMRLIPSKDYGGSP